MTQQMHCKRINGKIATAFPDANQSSVLKKRRKWVDYNEYVRSVEDEVNYAETKIDE